MNNIKIKTVHRMTIHNLIWPQHGLSGHYHFWFNYGIQDRVVHCKFADFGGFTYVRSEADPAYAFASKEISEYIKQEFLTVGSVSDKTHNHFGDKLSCWIYPTFAKSAGDIDLLAIELLATSSPVDRAAPETHA